MNLPRPLRFGLIGLACVVVIALVAGAVAIARFDPDSLKPRIEAAVKRATGRELTLNGEIGLKLALSPTIQVADAAFANPPGFSRPQMATLQGLELQLGLLPLLSGRYEINRLVLIHPDILLETDAAGTPNWRITPEVSPAAPAGSESSWPSRAARSLATPAMLQASGRLASTAMSKVPSRQTAVSCSSFRPSMWTEKVR